MVAEVLEPQRPRLLDQQPEDARGRVGRSPIARCVAASMPAVTKRSSSAARLVEHADGRVARAGDLARDVEQLAQDRLDVDAWR